MAVSAIQRRTAPLVWRHWGSAASIPPCGLRAQQLLRAPQGQGASIRTCDVPFRHFLTHLLETRAKFRVFGHFRKIDFEKFALQNLPREDFFFFLERKLRCDRFVALSTPTWQPEIA